MPQHAKRVLVAVVVGVLCVVGFAASRYQHTSMRRPADAFSGEVAQAASSHDEDGDGVADGEDILAGALAYVETRPRYGSRYYVGGWPDDGYGVCTDVTAQALRAAGYDLQALIDGDECEAPAAYGIETPDPNIDFRRVRNQRTWLERHSESLTTDILDVGAWQGGDIVVFDEHIGVVSDRRTRDGVPYVIHHEGPWQWAYEEDVLHRRSDVLGHYRLGA